MKTIAFFNNKGGVGKTSLVYHLAWMYADLGVSVVAADLDPQANLTSAFLNEDRLEEIWPDDQHPHTILGCVKPILAGVGDIADPFIEEIDEHLSLVSGDLGLSAFEDELGSQWPLCLDGKERAFRVLSAFYRVLDRAATPQGVEVVLIDIGPNLGAINRAALISADYVVVPLAPDLFSLQGLKNLGPTLRRWREEWKDRLKKNPSKTLLLPQGSMEPAGYVVLQHAVRLDRPVKAYGKWMARIPNEYRHSIRGEATGLTVSADRDPLCLATLKNYRSLMPMAQEVKKPIFHLLPADGAIGSHAQAVQECRKDFERLARAIAASCGIALPTPVR